MTKDTDAVFDCLDCGVNTNTTGEYYMVDDDIWAAAGLDPEGGMLCVADLEKRIGRRLMAADFTTVPINVPGLVPWIEHSDTLLDRLLTT